MNKFGILPLKADVGVDLPRIFQTSWCRPVCGDCTPYSEANVSDFSIPTTSAMCLTDASNFSAIPWITQPAHNYYCCHYFISWQHFENSAIWLVTEAGKILPYLGHGHGNQDAHYFNDFVLWVKNLSPEDVYFQSCYTCKWPDQCCKIFHSFSTYCQD